MVGTSGITVEHENGADEGFCNSTTRALQRTMCLSTGAASNNKVVVVSAIIFLIVALGLLASGPASSNRRKRGRRHVASNDVAAPAHLPLANLDSQSEFVDLERTTPTQDQSPSPSPALTERPSTSAPPVTSEKNRKHNNSDKQLHPFSVRIVFLGDSLTYGYGMKQLGHSKPYSYTRDFEKLIVDGKRGCPKVDDKLKPIIEQLSERSVNTTYVPWYRIGNLGVSDKTAGRKNKAYSYRKTPEWKLSLINTPQILFIMLGSNDSKSRDWTGKSGFSDALFEIITTHINAAAARRKLKPNFISNGSEGSGRNTTDSASTLQPKQDKDPSLHDTALPLQIYVASPPLISSSAEDGFAGALSGERVANEIREMVNETVQRAQAVALKIQNDLSSHHPETNSDGGGSGRSEEILVPSPATAEVHLVPLFDIWSKWLEDHPEVPAPPPNPANKFANGKPTALSWDGVHPTMLGHRIIATAFYEAACGGLV